MRKNLKFLCLKIYFNAKMLKLISNIESKLNILYRNLLEALVLFLTWILENQLSIRNYDNLVSFMTN